MLSKHDSAIFLSIVFSSRPALSSRSIPANTDPQSDRGRTVGGLANISLIVCCDTLNLNIAGKSSPD
jgi:hypothetical protein